jgi:hypothetical protein
MPDRRRFGAGAAVAQPLLETGDRIPDEERTMTEDETQEPEQPQTDLTTGASSARTSRGFRPRPWVFVVFLGLRLATIAACVGSPDDGDRGEVAAAAPGSVRVENAELRTGGGAGGDAGAGTDAGRD